MRTRETWRADGGFALTELAVVVLILSILATIAITTFFAQRHKADNVSAISTLKNLRTAAESIRADSASSAYTGVAQTYEAEQRSYEYFGGDLPSANPHQVSVDAADDGGWVSFAVSSGERCYYMRLERAADEVFKDTRTVDDSAVQCRAREFTSGSGAGWD